LGYGLITWFTSGNQRLAIGATAVLFLVGLALLLPINVKRGQGMAQTNASTPASTPA
jgi:UMF1 family MFS transporter